MIIVNQPSYASMIASLEDAATAQVAFSIKADPRRLTDGNIEHQKILRAVEKGDADRVVELITDHLRSTVQAVESLEESSDGSPASR